MGPWLTSGAIFAFVWALGFLVAEHSAGRLRTAIAPAAVLGLGGVWLLSGGLFLSGNLPLWMYGFHLPAAFLIGPLVLYYARSILNPLPLRGIDAMHAIPSAGAILCLMLFQSLSGEGQLSVFQGQGRLSVVFGAMNLGLKVSVLVYTAVVTVMFFRIVPRDSRYLPLLALYGAIIADLVVGIAGYAAGFRPLIAASAAGLPVILYAAFLASCRWPGMMGSLRADVSRQRYQKTRLLGMDVAGVVAELQRLMREEKAFSDEDVSLASLALELGIKPHQLSEILNERLHKSFSAYVNEYRVMEARELILKEPDRSLLSICHAAGFNSKSAFNRAFRQISGETPQEFKQSQKILSGIGSGS